MARRSKHWKQADKEFREWIEEKYPIYNSKGEELILHPDEEWVPFFYPKMRDRPDHTAYVSNYGRVVSFRNKNPLWIQQIDNKTSPYVKFDYNKYGQVLVWFSFAYRALQEGTSIPAIDYYEEIDSVEKLKEVAKRDDYEVHHDNFESMKNPLDHLELVSKKIHKKKTNNKDIHALYRNEMEENYDKSWGIAKNLDKGIINGKGRVIYIGEKMLKTEQIDQETIFEFIVSGIDPWTYYIQRMLKLAEKEYKHYFVGNERIVHIKVNNMNNIFNIYTYEDLSFKLCSMNTNVIESKVSYVAKVSEDKIDECIVVDGGQNGMDL